MLPPASDGRHAAAAAGLQAVVRPHSRLYHVREPETQRLDMPFPDFVQCAAQWRARRVHVRVRARSCERQQLLHLAQGSLLLLLLLTPRLCLCVF